MATRARACGFHTAEVDLCHAPLNDLSLRLPGVDARTLSREADIVGIDICCSSWSLARRAPPWSRMPHRLRSADHPFGLPALTGRDLAVCVQGNNMLKNMVRVIKDSLFVNGAGYLENPRSSYIWVALRKIFAAELKSKKMEIHHTCLCMYGTSWKKPTSLLIWGAATAPKFRDCTGPRGVCARTGCAHEALSSSSDVKCCIHNGGFRTRLAQVYPKAFAKYLFNIFLPVRGG